MRTRPHCTRPTANSTRFFFSPPVRVLLLPSHTLPSPPLSRVSTRLASLLFSSPPHLFSRSSRRSPPFGQDLGQPSQWPSLELDFRKDFLRAPSHLLGTLPCVAFTKYDGSYSSRKEVEKTRFVFDRTPPGRKSHAADRKGRLIRVSNRRA